VERLPKIIEEVKEQARKEILGKTADEKRKEGIKNTSPTTTGGKTDTKKAASLTPSQLEAAERLGFAKDPKKLARYAQMVGSKSGTYGTV
jgi:hypothetical protein